MSFCKLLLCIAPLLVACISGVAAIPISDVMVPLIPQGNIASATNPFQDGDRRFYYQDSTGVILEYSFNGFFGSGYTIAPPSVLVPADEVLPGTPISVIWKSNNGGEIHLYFLSRSRVVSEYYFAYGLWHGGASCQYCLTQYGFTSAAGTVELYSTVNTAGGIAVGHVSAGIPGTISEAVQYYGAWALYPIS